MEQLPPVSTAYNFTRSGAGDYSIEPSNRFTYVDGDGTLKDLYATVGDVARVELSGDLAVSQPVYHKRAPFIGCSPDQAQHIYTTALNAEVLVLRALKYMPGLAGPTPRSEVWLGPWRFPIHEGFRLHLLLIDRSRVSKSLYDCTCQNIYSFGYVGACIF